MALQVDYKVRIARNKLGTSGEVVRIKFAKGMVPNRLFDRCFVGVKDGYMYFKLFRGLSNVTAEFDDSKVFRIAYIGEMPGITISSKKFAKYFVGYEGEYDKVEWVSGYDYKNATKNEATMFRLYPGARHNFTNLYKNTSTEITHTDEEAEDKLQKQLDLIHRNSIYGIQVPKEEEPISETKDIATNSICGVTQAKPADSMTPNQIIALQKWHDENTQAKVMDTEKDIQSKVDLMVIRESYTGMYLKLYYKALEKKDEENVGYFKFKILSCLEFTDYRQFIRDVELALKGTIACGEKDYAEMILDSIPDLYELTRDYN